MTRSSGALLLMTTLLLAGCNSPQAVITPAEVRTLMTTDSTVVLLDVRTPEEYASETGHLPGALLIPVQELEQRLGELEPMRDRTIVAYCRSGQRSSRAAEILGRHGFRAMNMEGGIRRWREESLPVVHGQSR